jgi:predicted short-subunit dehydrogenase-like oxidoreductase (DUF2520 family)
MIQNNISFAGAGRVGSALCRKLFGSGYKIDMVASETAKNGKELAYSCKAAWSPELTFPETTKLIIVAVPDHRLQSVLRSIRCRKGTIVAHTAGSMGLDIFPESIEQKGIFYPLQTFSEDREINFDRLPFLLEASDDESSVFLSNLAESIGGKVQFIDSERRTMIHLAAVFVCNFTNHMLTEGNEVAGNAGLTLDIFEPLLKETISKALTLGPENAQTGPAIRNDQNTIEKHLDLLSFSPELQKVYFEMTQSIIKHYKKS